jgi:hypothetical protein
VDLWYHGLAVVGFDQAEGLPLYSPGYADRVKQAKQDQGVYPTPLDELAAELLEDLGEDRAFQEFHFLPLYFPTSDRAGMLAAVRAVAERRVNESTVGPDTRSGARWASGAFEEGSQRRVLRRFVEALEQEWDTFYAGYWEREVAIDRATVDALEREWNGELAPAVSDFLGEQGLRAGIVLLSSVLGPEGRLIPGNAFRGIADAVAVWSPGWTDVDASLYSILREMCFSIVDGSVINPATVRRGDPQIISGRAAIRCGALLVQRHARSRLGHFQAAFLRAAGADTIAADTAAEFTEAFQVPSRVLEAVRAKLWPDEIAAQSTTDEPGWLVQTAAHIDLWYHGLAVISADQPGPLGLYSADYASRIREIKRERGVYPTRLDSMVPDLRDGVAAANADLHFLPMYFERSTPEQFLETVRAVAGRRPENANLGQPQDRFYVIRLTQIFSTGRSRRLLEQLADALETEWEVFYESYWQELTAREEPRYDAMQSMWDSLFVPALGPYLEQRKLTAGSVYPAAALGPEGRIVDDDEGDPRDQVVAVQMPLSADGPEPSVFAFLKELCFLLVDPADIGIETNDRDELEDLRRRVAVRCGHLVLQFYAPTLTAGYRRVFLDAVGAEESYTIAAFERVYFVEPEVFDRVRERIRRR